MNSTSLCSLAGLYNNPIPTRFLAPIDCLKIPAQIPFTGILCASIGSQMVFMPDGGNRKYAENMSTNISRAIILYTDIPCAILYRYSPCDIVPIFAVKYMYYTDILRAILYWYSPCNITPIFPVQYYTDIPRAMLYQYSPCNILLIFPVQVKKTPVPPDGLLLCPDYTGNWAIPDPIAERKRM
jgi:hypothetical protein